MSVTITCVEAMTIALMLPQLVYVTPKRFVPWWWVLSLVLLLGRLAGLQVEIVHP